VSTPTWVTVGFLAGRTARSAIEATLLGALAEAAAVVAFYRLKYATEGVPWVPAALYLPAALATGLVFGWLGFISSRGRRIGLMVLAGTWIAEPLGWIALEYLRAGHPSLDTAQMVAAMVELLVGLLLAVTAFRAATTWRR
jgi:hypothetical protein